MCKEHVRKTFWHIPFAVFHHIHEITRQTQKKLQIVPHVRNPRLGVPEKGEVEWKQEKYLSQEKKNLTFHYTGCLIGILWVVPPPSNSGK